MKRREFFQRAALAGGGVILSAPSALGWSRAPSPRLWTASTVSRKSLDEVIKEALANLPQQNGNGPLTNYGNEWDWNNAARAAWHDPALQSMINIACWHTGPLTLLFGLNPWVVGASVLCAIIDVYNQPTASYSRYQGLASNAYNGQVSLLEGNRPTPPP